MITHSFNLRERVFNYSLTHKIYKKTDMFRCNWILMFVVFVIPALTNANPEQLAQDKNCFSCHKIEAKRIGPSYIDVARKYCLDTNAQAKIIKQIQEGGIDRLSNRDLPPQPIVATVSGFPTANQWRNYAMPPQPQVNAEEAKELADWILSLGKKNETWSKNKQEQYCLSPKAAEGYSVH